VGRVAPETDGDALTERHWQLLRLLVANSKRKDGRLVSWWPQDDKHGRSGLAASLGVKPRQLRNLLADLRQPGSDPRHPTTRPPGRRLGWIKVEPTTYTDPASGRHRLGGNVYVVTEAGQQALAQHDQQAMAREPVSAAYLNRQWPPIAGLNKRNPASEENRASSPLLTAVSNPRRYRCGWDGCDGCGAVAAFEAKWQAGKIRPAPVITSPRWESATADAVYVRGGNLPACHHPDDLPAWPAVPDLRLQASA
jgi:hypothetical protein